MKSLKVIQKNLYSESYAKLHTCCRYILNVHAGFAHTHGTVSHYRLRHVSVISVEIECFFQHDFSITKLICVKRFCVCARVCVCHIECAYHVIAPWIEYIDIDIAIISHRLTENIQITNLLIHRTFSYMFLTWLTFWFREMKIEWCEKRIGKYHSIPSIHSKACIIYIVYGILYRTQ